MDALAPHLPVLLVLVPLFGGLLASLMPRRGPAPWLWSLAVTFSEVVLALSMVKEVRRSPREAIDYFMGWWPAEYGIAYEIDALNAYVINKKYFASEEGARQFFLTAEQLHQNALMLEGGQTFKALPSPHPSTQRGPAPSTQTMAPSPMPRMPQASPGRLLPQGGGTGTDGTI